MTRDRNAWKPTSGLEIDPTPAAFPPALQRHERAAAARAAAEWAEPWAGLVLEPPVPGGFPPVQRAHEIEAHLVDFACGIKELPTSPGFVVTTGKPKPVEGIREAGPVLESGGNAR